MLTLCDVSVLVLWRCLYVDSVMCLSYFYGDVFMLTLCDVSVLVLWRCLYVDSLWCVCPSVMEMSLCWLCLQTVVPSVSTQRLLQRLYPYDVMLGKEGQTAVVDALKASETTSHGPLHRLQFIFTSQGSLWCVKRLSPKTSGVIYKIVAIDFASHYSMTCENTPNTDIRLVGIPI